MKKLIKILMIIGILAICASIVYCAITYYIIPSRTYALALEQMESDDIDKSIDTFSSLGSFAHSEQKIVECREIITAEIEIKYQEALELMGENEYSQAKDAFILLDGYKECRYNISLCNYFDTIILIDDVGIKNAIAKNIELSDDEIHLYQLLRLTHLDLSNLDLDNSQMVFFQYLISLKSLNLAGAKIQSFSKISFFGNLTSLNLSGSDITDLSLIESLTSLEDLNISSTNTKDLSPLSSMENIKKLDISHTNVKKLDAIANMPNLEELYIHVSAGGNPALKDLSPLAEATKMKILSIVSDNSTSRGVDIYKLEPLENMASLEYLVLNNCDIRDVSSLGKLTSLKLLDLSHNKIENISPLSTLININELVLNDNKIDSLRSLSTLSELTHLYVCDNNYTSLKGIEKIQSLEVLEVGGDIRRYTDLKNISAVKDLTSLKTFKCENNNVSDLSAIENLSSLTHLSLRKTGIIKINQLANLSNLKELYIDADVQSSNPSIIDKLQELGCLISN